MNSWLSNKFHWMSFIATWAVVCIHSHTMRWIDGDADWANRTQLLLLNAFHFAVPLFFVISGYMFVLSWEKYNKQEFFKKKLLGLYVPAVLCSWIIMLLVLPIRIYSGNCVPNWYDWLKVVLLDFSSGCNHFWYIRALIVAFMLSPLLYLCIKKWWLGAILMLVSAMVHYDVHWFTINIPRTVFYMIGGGLLAYYVGAENLYRLRDRGGQVALIGACIILIATVARKWNVLFFESFSLPVGQILLLSGLYDMVDRKWPKSCPKSFQVMFFVYCFHLVVICWVGGCLRLSIGSSAIARMSAYFMLWMTFWLDVLLANGIKKVAPACYQLLSGSR